MFYNNDDENEQLRKESVNNAVEHTLEKIKEAIEEGVTTIRVYTGIAYNDLLAEHIFENEMEQHGYKIDGESQVRHGFVVDIDLVLDNNLVEDNSHIHEAVNYALGKIENAKEEGLTTIRVHTGIAYSDSNAEQLFIEKMKQQGYEVDGESQVRHGFVVDIDLQPTQKYKL